MTEIVSAKQAAAFEFEPLAPDDAAAMFRDFSKDVWERECAQHGVALRIAWTILAATKEKIVEATEGMESDYSGSGPGPTFEILQTFKHSHERFKQLAQILKAAEARQLSHGIRAAG